MGLRSDRHSLPRQLRLSVQSAPANFDAGQDDHLCHRSEFEAALGCVPKARLGAAKENNGQAL